MKYSYRLLAEQEVYRGFFKITRFTVDFDYFSGGTSGPIVRECLGKGQVVAALPYDPVRDEFVFVEQFRIGRMVAGAGPWNTEIVAGFIDKPDETPEQSMQRELEEEIGVRAQILEPIGQYFSSPGGSGGRVYLYQATVDAAATKTFTGLHEEGEDIRVIRVPRKTALQWLGEGKISNATMLIAMQSFALRAAQNI